MTICKDFLKISEKEIEDNISNTLNEIGYSKIEPFNNENLQNIINFDILRSSLEKINNNLEKDYIIEAIKEIKNLNFVNNNVGKYEGNSQILYFLKSGIPIKIPNINQGRTINVGLIDYKNLENNNFNYCRQLSILDDDFSYFRPDIIIYINGLPISIFEIKTIESNDGLSGAIKQLKNYVLRKYELFWWNIISVVTNSYNTQIVDLQNNKIFNWNNNFESSNYENCFFENDINGLFKKDTLLKIIKNYVHYSKKDSKNIKFFPRYHQFVCCEKCFLQLQQENKKKCGFVWHTQGSGKTITMLFLAKQIMQMETSNKYKIVFVTDRNSLDNQLFNTFKSANKFLNLEAKQISSRNELIDVLSKDNNPGIYMTTIQKFFEKTNVLSNKDNIIVIADEAHRSHNNIEIEEEYDDKKSELIFKKGYAYFLREAFPNAKFIGFTGTPLLKDDKTKEVFGDIIHKYTMSQAEHDNAVVPIKYQKILFKEH